ncbi:hypothetical protein CUMW_234810, partial [Citrus unshiu]
TSEIEARKVEVQLCSSSYGDVKNISYPFRLKGDPAGCGHPELQLPCESNKIILEFNSGKYYVKRISYDKCTISVAEAFTKVPCLSDNQSNVYVYPGYAGINDKISDLPDYRICGQYCIREQYRIPQVRTIGSDTTVRKLSFLPRSLQAICQAIN